MDMPTGISSSAVAGLVLGYLKASNNPLTARQMLEESPHLKEVRRSLRKKKMINTKVDNMTLCHILKDYFFAKDLVRDLTSYLFHDQYPGGIRDMLSAQFLDLMEEINQALKLKSQSKDETVMKMDSAKDLFTSRITRQKQALFNMKRTAREEDALGLPHPKKIRISEERTPDALKETDGQAYSANPSLGASKRKKNLLVKKNVSNTEMSPSQNLDSQQESPENLKEVLEYLTSDKAAPIHQRIADKITEAYFLQPEEKETTASAGKSTEVPKEKSVASEIEELVRKFQHTSDPVTDMVLHSVMGESFGV